MANITALISLDEALMAASKGVKALYYVEPSNEKDQKQEFLSGRKQNPHFLYKDLEYDPQKVAQRLEAIETPDNELGAIFEKRRKGILLENRIIVHRGDEDIVREATIALYGFPNEQLVACAGKLLRQIPNIEAAKTISSEKIKDALQRALDDYGLLNWRVEFSDKKLTTVYPGERKITVCRDRKFAEIDPKRLSVHEVGVHVLRAANGYEQPLKIFALGLPGYLPTEEGLTSYFEELTGNTSEETMRDYAARVIAVDSVCRSLDFRQTFERLKSYDITDEQTWNLAVRAHRAGGYIKDHVYLDGNRRVKEFATKEGDFNMLYAGTVGIEDLPLVRKLVQEGILREPKYKPSFLHSTGKQE